MIRVPSLVHPTPIIWSRDPALIDHDPNDEEWNRKLKVSRETGDYSAILKPGEKPAFFHMAIIRPTVLRSVTPLWDESTQAVFWSTVFRLSIQSVENVEGLAKIEKEQHAEFGAIAKESVVDELDRVSPSIVNEIAVIAFQRSSAPFSV